MGILQSVYIGDEGAGSNNSVEIVLNIRNIRIMYGIPTKFRWPAIRFCNPGVYWLQVYDNSRNRKIGMIALLKAQ